MKRYLFVLVFDGIKMNWCLKIFWIKIVLDLINGWKYCKWNRPRQSINYCVDSTPLIDFHLDMFKQWMSFNCILRMMKWNPYQFFPQTGSVVDDSARICYISKYKYCPILFMTIAVLLENSFQFVCSKWFSTRISSCIDHLENCMFCMVVHGIWTLWLLSVCVLFGRNVNGECE